MASILAQMTAVASNTTIAPRRLRGRPRAEDLAALEERIISAGTQLFVGRGYGAATMSDVAQAAQVSKTTLYARFSSKADLFRAIVAAQVRSWTAGFPSPPMEQCDTPEETLLAYGNMALRIGLSPDYVQMSRLIYSESWRFPELGEAADARFKMGVEELAWRFQVFVERDPVRWRDPLPMLELFQLMLMGWCSVMILGNRPIVPEQRDAWLARTVSTLLRAPNA